MEQSATNASFIGSSFFHERLKFLPRKLRLPGAESGDFPLEGFQTLLQPGEPPPAFYGFAISRATGLLMAGDDNFFAAKHPVQEAPRILFLLQMLESSP